MAGAGGGPSVPDTFSTNAWFDSFQYCILNLSNVEVLLQRGKNTEAQSPLNQAINDLTSLQNKLKTHYNSGLNNNTYTANLVPSKNPSTFGWCISASITLGIIKSNLNSVIPFAKNLDIFHDSVLLDVGQQLANLQALADGLAQTIDAGNSTGQVLKVNNRFPDTGVFPGSYTSANITVTSDGRITAISNGSGGGGSIPNSGVVSGNYVLTNLTVGSDGRITAASNGNVVLDPTGVASGEYTNASITVGEDGRITSASNGSVVLDPTGVASGEYTSATITVGEDGRITAASNGTAGGVTVDTSGDSSFSSVSLLMHFDGSNGSTIFTNSGNAELTISAEGSPVLSTSQQKFGTASLSLDGGSDVKINDNSALDLSSGDSTVECWFYPTTVDSDTRSIIDKRRFGWGTDYNIAFTNTQMKIGYSNGNGNDFSGSPTVNTWNHVALVQSGSSLKLYLNGTSVGTASGVINTNSSDRPLRIGARDGGAEYFSGYIDEVRITKGVARYTANFTPSASAFPDSAGTLPSNPTVGQLFSDGVYLYLCLVGGESPVWKKVTLT